MSFCQILTPKQKALEVNLNDTIYGSLAEIGAGQEVARHFFRAGGAAGTIAKTMSAYDMTVSDIIYGKSPSGRYVSEERMLQMLDTEYGTLVDRLKDKRSDSTRFFAFADTVAAKSYSGRGQCHGWLGVRFQHEAGAEPSQIVIHVKMLDKENLQQQEAIGVLGANMIHALYYHLDDIQVFISRLMDYLTKDRLEIDMIRVEGKAFEGIDSRLVSLELVKRGWTQAVIFDSCGQVAQVSDKLYKKHVLAVRGSFRPPTLINIDMMEAGLKQFEKDLGTDALVLPVISMSQLLERGEVDSKDFLARVKILADLGYKVLISKHKDFHQLKDYLFGNTRRKIGFVLGVFNVDEIFNEKRNEDMDGGLLSSLGHIFGEQSQVYIYPMKEEDVIHTTDNASISDDAKLLLDYLKKKGWVKDLDQANKDVLHIWSREVLEKIASGEKGWESMVPELVAKKVKEKKLFGFKG